MASSDHLPSAIANSTTTSVSAANVPHVQVTDAQNTKIVEEFQYLLEKSQQYFAGLRDLPPNGNQKTWQPYFQKTFEVYTKLWKFQQDQRAILENKENYGLKRWEIGEIASKIGQLYYHYYLRTSETNYLLESLVFYEAIRDRAYFKDVLDAKNSVLMIKKLRYYARFIVVCLLLNRNDFAKKLMEELNALVEEYTKVFKTDDAAEWTVVLHEIYAFLEADKNVVPVDYEGLSVPVRTRLGATTNSAQDVKWRLHEAILVGNHLNQVKFSELTLDMYRMLQALEREPVSAVSVKQEETAETETAPSNTTQRRVNPHKHLLYRPSISQMLHFLSSSSKELPDNGVLMLYLSADSHAKTLDASASIEHVRGGVLTNATRGKPNPSEWSATEAIQNCFHVMDLLPFTRRALFLVVDSPNSTAYQNVPRLFGQPLLVLMSPNETPSSIKEASQNGSLFTLFLYAPLLAFCLISNVSEISADNWSKAQECLASLESALLEQLLASSDLAADWKLYLADEFMRSLLIRFCLMRLMTSANVNFSDAKYWPQSSPAVPQAVIQATPLAQMLHALATTTGGLSLYPNLPAAETAPTA